MIVSRVVLYDMKKIFSDWFLYMSLILSFLPAMGIAYAIKNLDGPFTLEHVTSFYALFGTIMSVVVAMRLYTDDLSNETITLVINNKKNRVKYLLSKVFGFALVGLVFGVLCALTLLFVKEYLAVLPESSLYLKTIVNYTLFTTLYTILFFFISIFYRNVAAIFVIAVLSISFLPNLFGTLLDSGSLPESLNTVIESLPIYYLPILIGSHNLDGVQYLTVAVFLLVFFLGSFFAIRSRDY
ncbi:hypothetical protein [Paraliobacillus zengyii]|uniref:hypothetical protein n=1 Tax=Paraliobacillus zengyii TaxID=2213194 RepID=UPI000E3C02C5|nr:hypothetical protein [Paraliobacillus zengyii]